MNRVEINESFRNKFIIWKVIQMEIVTCGNFFNGEMTCGKMNYVEIVTCENKLVR